MLQKSQTTTRDVNKKPVNSGINYLSLNWWQLGSPSLEKTRCSSGAHWGSFQVTSLRLSLERIKPGHFVCSQTGTFWDSIPYIPRKLADLCHDMLSMVLFFAPKLPALFFLKQKRSLYGRTWPNPKPETEKKRHIFLRAMSFLFGIRWWDFIHPAPVNTFHHPGITTTPATPTPTPATCHRTSSALRITKTLRSVEYTDNILMVSLVGSC